MKRHLTFALMLMLAASAVAQIDLDRFNGIRSQGPIPQDLRLSLNELYTQDKQRARDYNDGRLRASDRVLSASYNINRLMASGRVLYGDPVTQMLNRIADTLFKDYPQLRQELRIYTIKSPEVNAFATGQGMLFVTTGLVAQVENEAQLAFILGHEAIHYYKQHNWETITRTPKDTKSEKGKTKKDKSQKSSTQGDAAKKETRDFIKYHNRSHAMENEADSLCLQLFFLSSAYQKDITDGVFDVLQYGYLPFDEIKIDSNYFDSKYYHFSHDYFLDTVASITARDDYDDSKSTHPNLLKRRLSCASVIGRRTDGAPFLVTTPEQFASIRDLARLECIRQNLIYAEYTRALYDIMIMQGYMPNNRFLAAAKAQALYGLSKFRNNTSSREVCGDYKTIEGEAQQAYYFFRKINNDELNMMALRQLWMAHRADPQNPILLAMAQDAACELVTKNSRTSNYFLDTYDTTSAAASAQVEETKTKSKYDRIKQKRKQQGLLDMRPYFFTDLFETDDTFRPFLDSCSRHASDSFAASVSTHHNMFAYASEYYVATPNRLKQKKSDRMEARLTDYLRDVASLEDRGLVDFSDQGLRSHTEEQVYNDFVAINEWAQEFWQTSGDFDRMLTLQPLMNDLVQRYDADRLNMTQVINVEGLGAGLDAPTIIISVVFPLLWPVLINRLMTGFEETFVQSAYVDATTGHMLGGTRYHFKTSDSPALIKATIYDNMMRAQGRKNCSFLDRHFLVQANLVLGRNMLSNGQSFIAFTSPSTTQSKFHLRPELGLEYIINAHHAIHATAGYNYTAMQEAFRNPRWTVELTDHMVGSFSLGYRHYKHLAPLGGYWGFNLQYHTLKLDTIARPTVALSSSGSPRLNQLGVGFEMGTNHIFFNHLVFNLGARFSLMGNFEPSKFEYHFRYFDNDFNFGRRLLTQNLLTLTLGLGYLPF